ncbi:hypothetical protein BY996DRAFT_6526263 [Phakopsora pachyrhizi]|nr:hypothetical protein BY996DRAFT_6526263 [Phakopsora pachyrhizi]
MTCLSDVEEHVAPVNRERNKEDDLRSGGGPGGHRVSGEQLVMRVNGERQIDIGRGLVWVVKNSQQEMKTEQLDKGWIADGYDEDFDKSNKEKSRLQIW